MARRSSDETNRRTKSGKTTGKQRKRGGSEKSVSNVRRAEGQSLEQWQVALRKKAAMNSHMAVNPVGGKWSLGEFQVSSASSRRVYNVVYRGNASRWNYCSCLDFKTSRLGTCKHLEAVKLWAVDNPTHISRRVPPYSSVYLSYVEGRKVKLRIGSEHAAAMAMLARDYFDANMCLRADAIERFPLFLVEAKKISDTFRCYDDALDYVIGLRDDKERQELARSLTDEVLDQLLTTKLFPYQKEGVRFAVEKGRTVIADEMGLGKTIQAIATAEVLRRNRRAESVIVACPSSLKYQWKSEIERFAGAQTLVIEGDVVKRRQLYGMNVPYKIVSYHMLSNDVRYAGHIDTDILILDEVQRLKNWDTQIAVSARRVKSKYVVALSGTPLENKVEELYSVMELVDQYCLAPYYDFRHRYIVQNELGKVMGYRNLNEIGERIASRLIRRRKADVAIQLPQRQDKNLLVPMTPQQIDAHEEYKSVVARIVQKWYRTHFLSEAERMRLLLNLNMMRMVCDSTYILDESTRHDVKVDEAANIIAEYIEGEGSNKVVVFSQWERMARLIAGELEHRGIAHEYLHGAVPSVKRGAMVYNFQNDPQCKVFVSTDAGSTGLNLQSASLVINIDLPWNPAVLEQRIGRIYRYGQMRNIMVINLVAKNSIEEQMIGKLRFKQNMFEGILDGGEDAIFVEDKFAKIVELADTMVTTDEPADDAPGDEPAERGEHRDPLIYDSAQQGAEDDFDDDADDYRDNAVSDLDDDDDVFAESIIKEIDGDAPGSGTLVATTDDIKKSSGGGSSTASQSAPEELISQGLSFLSNLAQTLQSPQATTELLDAIVKEDPDSGRAYLNIPVPDKSTVRNALTIFAALLGKK